MCTLGNSTCSHDCHDSFSLTVAFKGSVQLSFLNAGPTQDTFTFLVTLQDSCTVHFKRFDAFTRTDATFLFRTSFRSSSIGKLLSGHEPFCSHSLLRDSPGFCICFPIGSTLPNVTVLAEAVTPANSRVASRTDAEACRFHRRHSCSDFFPRFVFLCSQLIPLR